MRRFQSQKLPILETRRTRWRWRQENWEMPLPGYEFLVNKQDWPRERGVARLLHVWLPGAHLSVCQMPGKRRRVIFHATRPLKHEHWWMQGASHMIVATPRFLHRYELEKRSGEDDLEVAARVPAFLSAIEAETSPFGTALRARITRFNVE